MKKSLLGLGLLCATMAVACTIANKEERCTRFKVRFTSDLDPRIVQATLDAMADWKFVMGDALQYEPEVVDPYVQGFLPCTIKVKADPLTEKNFGTGPAIREPDSPRPTAGILSFHTRVIGSQIDNPALLHAIALHEIGHILGLEHNENRSHDSVMWPAITVPGRIGFEDARRVEQIWGPLAFPIPEGQGWLT